MPHGHAERAICSSLASFVRADIPTGANVNGSNVKSSPGDSENLTEVSLSPLNVSNVHSPSRVNAKKTRSGLTANNFDSFYASTFSVKRRVTKTQGHRTI